LRLTAEEICAEGQLGNARGLGTTVPNPETVPVVLPGAIMDEEVVSVTMSQGHAIVQTKTNVIFDNVNVRPRGSYSLQTSQFLNTWVWGSNTHGQLGGRNRGVPWQNVPTLLSPALFPRREDGNEVVREGGSFSVVKWNASCICFDQINVSLPKNSILGLDMLEEHINKRMEPGAVSFTIGANNMIQVELNRPGYQLDLTQTDGVARMLGFHAFRIPASGVFKEISSRLNNNILVYKYFSGKIPISNYNRVFKYLVFDATMARSNFYSITLADGEYTPSELVAAINAGAAANQHDELLNIIGSPTPFTYDDKLSLRIPRFKGRALLELDKLYLGHTVLPPENTYFPMGVPNEVSTFACTNRLQVRYMSNETAPVIQFDILLSAGIKTLDEVQQAVQQAIRDGFVLNQMSPLKNAFELYTTANDPDYVVLEIAQDGFQILFSNTTNKQGNENSLANYLGFARESIPWNRTCGNSTWCAMSKGLLRKRAQFARPMVSKYKSTGTCSLGVCACTANG